MSYVEFPTDRIVDVHFKKKPDEGPPSPCQPGSELCNTYSMGATVGFVSSSLISAVMGPEAVIPFVGSFSTVGPNGDKGRYGGLNHPPSSSIPETMTAAPYGLIATSILLEAGDMQFTNQQLQSLADDEHHVGTYGWIVPMAQGSALLDPGDKFSECIPILVDTYTIDVAWGGTFNEGNTYGIAIQHPIPGFSGVLTPPSVPIAIFDGGGGSYSYPFRWKEWVLGEFHYDEGNQYDDALGGPALLWWMGSRDGGLTWSANAQFMGSTLIGLGDTYSWTISCTCMKEPNLFSSRSRSRRR